MSEIRSRQEIVAEFPVVSGARIKRIRILSDAVIDDIMMNAIRAEAMKLKTGQDVTPSYGRDVTDYLIARGKVRT